MTWSQRLARVQQKWTDMLPLLVDAFLKFKHGSMAAEPAAGEVFMLPVFNVYGKLNSVKLSYTLFM